MNEIKWNKPKPIPDDVQDLIDNPEKYPDWSVEIKTYGAGGSKQKIEKLHEGELLDGFRVPSYITKMIAKQNEIIDIINQTLT